MKKLFISVIIFVALVAAFICGCNNDAVDMKKRLDALEESNGQLQNRVDELEKENDILWDVLYECGFKDGGFYSLQQAYDAGWITKEDLKSIAYYHNGGIEGNEEVMGADFDPQPKMPEAIDKMTELSIKQTYCNNLREESNAKPSGVTIERYYGSYNGCYAVVLDSIYIDHYANVVDEWRAVEGIQIHYTDHFFMTIWKVKGD
ncbi:MAG: hypothetical protein K2J83_06485 [Clostridia bacterium]|nr:hypothetical protein [Clostridia bacterium]